MSRHCSFCDLPEEVLDQLVMHAGNDVGICDRCVKLCGIVMGRRGEEARARGAVEYDSWPSIRQD